MSPRKLFPSSGVLKKLLNAAKPDPDGLFMHNRNPRNLEMMKIAYKPYGYHLERPGRCFWHKWVNASVHLNLFTSNCGQFLPSHILFLVHRLILNKTNKAGVTAQVLHYKNGVVLEASTNEWSLRRQLYRSYDTAAYINLGKVIGDL